MINLKYLRIDLKLILILLWSVISLNLLAQKETGGANHHDNHKNEIGIANSPVYFVKENTFAYGLHLHVTRNINKTKFAFGLGYERIFDEHQHSTYGFIVSYKPIEPLSFNVSPGVTIEKGNSDVNFALHLETSYEFDVKRFHVGPAIEFAYDPEDIHLSIGLHIGYAF